jgi:putative DNA primase/helicase
MDSLNNEIVDQKTTFQPEAVVAHESNTVCAPGGPFSLRSGGVYFLEEDKDGNMTSEWVCSPLRIMARTRNAEGQEWGTLLEVVDPEGVVHRWAMPSRLMAGSGDSYRSELLAMGLRISPMSGKKRVDLYLTTARVDSLARCVERIGWYGHAFVLPDTVYGEQADEEIVHQGLPSENPFRQKGSLEEWQEHVGRVCAGNSRLVLAVCTALAAPLLEPLGVESGGLHIVGGSSLGKTTALRVAGSACGGGPGGFIKQWRATDNGLEGIAAAHCDSLLCLDEMGQAGAKVVSEVAYMLANGQGKGRASRDGQARKVQMWRLLFLSTGEITLSDKVAEEGRARAKAGQAVRVVDIPADAGVGLGLFETLHGCESADLFARKLKEASSRYYGTPLRTFLQALVADRDNITWQAQEIVRTFETENYPVGADGQVGRVCGRFALVAAAGELGVSLGVLPWTAGEASKAAATCFNAWVKHRGGTGAAELSGGLEQVRAFFQAHGSARFEDLDAGEGQRISNRAGYRRRENGQAVFWIFPDVFKREICSGFNDRMICTELERSGISMPEVGRHTRKVRTPDGQTRMIVLNSLILGGNTGNTGNNAENTGENLFPPVPTSGLKWEQEKSNYIEPVPTVPTVPSENSVGERILPSDIIGKKFPKRMKL